MVQSQLSRSLADERGSGELSGEGIEKSGFGKARNMVKKVNDLLKGERAFLSAIKKRPGMYLKEISLRNFEFFSHGYETAMRLATHNEHRLSPCGFIEYSAEKYKDRLQGSYNVFGFISRIEPDDEKAFYLYFELLDEYLVSLGYEPIPEWVGNSKIDFFTGKEI